MTIDEVIGTVHAFPTLSEAVKLVAQSVRRDVSKLAAAQNKPITYALGIVSPLSRL